MPTAHATPRAPRSHTAASAPPHRRQPMPAATQGSVASQVAGRIAQGGRSTPGRVYTPFDFLDLGSPHTIGMALLRLVRAGTLRRLARGLYDVPRSHPLLGELQPTADEIAQALARRDGANVRPAEAMAANMLSLSDQVPARAVFETDGPSRTVKVGALLLFGLGHWRAL